MKKSLVALAALAATGAFAQSSVTLYGVADAYIGSKKVTKPTGLAVASPLVSESQTLVNSGGLSGSRVGLNVKEDLGNGLTGLAVLEAGGSIDTGTGLSARKAVVGLEGGFGTLTFGRQTTPIKDGNDKLTDAQAASVFSAMSAAGNFLTQGSPYTERANNSIRYDAPDMNGFKAAFLYGMGEDKTATSKANKILGLSVGYAAPGSFAVGFSHQTEDRIKTIASKDSDGNLLYTPPFGAGNPPPVVTNGNHKLTINYLSGAVATPIGKLSGGFGYGKLSGVSGKDKGANIGLTIPVGSWTGIIQVARFKADGELGNLYNTANRLRVTPSPALRSGGATRTAIGLEGHYALSKRTTSYVGYNQTKNVLGITGAKYQLFGVGVRHVF